VVQPSEKSMICKAETVSQEFGSPVDFRQTMPHPERRLQRRLALHWRLRLSCGPVGPLETRTENLSSQGFYCILETPLVPGDVVTCDITIPSYSSSDPRSSSIACQAEVIRVEAVGTEWGFGVACRILDYSLKKHGASLHS
jgi:hypothetical protein